MLRILLVLPLGSLLASGVFIALAQLSGLPKERPLSPPDLAPIQLFKLTQPSELHVRQRQLPEAPSSVTPVPPNQLNLSPAPHQSSLAPVTLSNLSLPDLDSAEFNHDLSLANGLINSELHANAASGPLIKLSIQPQYRHPPEYPLAARRRNIEGSVTLEFTVKPNGEVLASSIRVVDATPSGVFEQAAKRTISQWRYPINQQTTPFGFNSRQKIEFKLTHDQ